MTSPKRTAPFASASFAAATHASTDFSPHVSHAVFQCADCAHHLQFSEHVPHRALRIAQKSKTSALNASVTWCAAAKRSSFAAVSTSRRISSGVASPPATIRSARAWAGFPSFVIFHHPSRGRADARPAKPHYFHAHPRKTRAISRAARRSWSCVWALMSATRRRAAPRATVG